MQSVLLLILLAFYSVHGQDVPAALQEIVTEKEIIVQDLRDFVEGAWSSRCSVSCDCLGWDSCKGGLPLTCSYEFGQDPSCECEGKQIMTEQSSMFFTEGVSTTNEYVKRSVCFSEGLDSKFNELFADHPQTKWTYFGSATGTWRFYPGIIWEQDEFGNCDRSLDPRIRPWYVATSTGPKDVVLILDTSGSMGQFNRLSIAKQAAKSVIGTLDNFDYVTVINFASSVSSASNLLMRATSENKQSLNAYIDTMQDTGATNYEIAFNRAFDILEDSTTQERTSGCETAILFLSDGDVTDGLDGDDLVGNVTERNMNSRNATIFTYGFGAGLENQEVPKAIACENNGVFAALDDFGDLRGQMNSYYEYFAAGIESNEIVWSEIYVDAFGLGQMTTAGIACYNREVTPPALIGVVATDVLLSELTELADRSTIENFLLSRSKTCPDLELNPCQLEHFREASAGPGSVCGLDCDPFEPIESSCTGGQTGTISSQSCNTESELDSQCCVCGAYAITASFSVLFAVFIFFFLI